MQQPLMRISKTENVQIMFKSYKKICGLNKYTLFTGQSTPPNAKKLLKLFLIFADKFSTQNK
jgi:hypothetical protein